MAWAQITATARRDGLDGDETAFVLAKKARGYPDAAIANMIGRNIELVRQIALAPSLVAVARPRPPQDVIEPPKATPPAKAQAREWRKSYPRSVRITLERIAERNGLTVADLTSGERVRAVAWPRQEAMYELSQLGFLSLQRIGNYLGGRDHTTVLHGIAAHEDRVASKAYANRADTDSVAI